MLFVSISLKMMHWCGNFTVLLINKSQLDIATPPPCFSLVLLYHWLWEVLECSRCAIGEFCSDGKQLLYPFVAKHLETDLHIFSLFFLTLTYYVSASESYLLSVFKIIHWQI